jgi:riboflavin synthase
MRWPERRGWRNKSNATLGIRYPALIQVDMFTGIIEGLGTLKTVTPGNGALQLIVEADFGLDGTKLGDSIAVNGACLTVTRLQGRRFHVDVSPETVEKTTFRHAKIGARLNLERALRLSDRLDGHLVSGHVDGIGRLSGRQTLANAILLTFEVSSELGHYMIKKGSVAVDGVSLTINDCDTTHFQVSIIPHTAEITTVGLKGVGAGVNIETDMIGKYVERFLAGSGKSDGPTTGSGVDMTLLARSGFLD